jgi:hypothetical protein
MIDHAPYFNALKRAERENAEMAELEQRAAPLHWALMLAVFALCLAGIVDQSRDAIQRYADLAAANEAMVQCLNGHILNIGGALVSCQVHEAALIAEVRP